MIERTMSNKNSLFAKRWGGIGNLFLNAFECFKETWTGKIEPPELKNLSIELDVLCKKCSQVPFVAQHPNSFYATQASKNGSLNDDATQGLTSSELPQKGTF